MKTTILRDIFAAKLRQIRIEKGMSQEKLADIVGLHRTYIGSIERGERNISIDNISKIANALKIAPESLLKK